MPAYDHDGFVPPAPVARVMVRHPDSGKSVVDVPMLIDSGADSTLLPRSIVRSIDLPTTGEHYPLQGFDGSTVESEAVHAVLVFLNKTLRGRFLQVDSVGIIGRNVLSALCLVLNGPGQEWHEGPGT